MTKRTDKEILEEVNRIAFGAERTLPDALCTIRDIVGEHLKPEFKWWDAWNLFNSEFSFASQEAWKRFVMAKEVAELSRHQEVADYIFERANRARTAVRGMTFREALGQIGRYSSIQDNVPLRWANVVGWRAAMYEKLETIEGSAAVLRRMGSIAGCCNMAPGLDLLGKVQAEAALISEHLGKD